MCHPASFVVTRDRVYWSMVTDSHTEIIAEYGLHEDGVRGVNVVKVEISPANGQLDSDPAGWGYKLDQDRVPDWYDAAECERRARVALAEWVAARVITTDRESLDGPGLYWVCGSAHIVSVEGSAHIGSVGGSATVCRKSPTAQIAEPSSPMAVVIDRTGLVAVCSVGPANS